MEEYDGKRGESENMGERSDQGAKKEGTRRKRSLDVLGC